MASEARSLLDEQIAAVKALRDTARHGYSALAAIPVMTRQAVDNAEVAQLLPSILVRLATEDRTKLDACLDRAEHLLGPTDSAYVPVPMGGGIFPSACDGLSNALLQLQTLLFVAADLSAAPTEADKLAAYEADKLAAALAERWRCNGYDEWLLTVPTAEFERLADVASQESDAAIQRLTNQFQAAAIRTETKPTTDLTAYSTDFRSVRWFGERYTFTTTQAACVQVLWRNWEQGTPVISEVTILDDAGSAGDRLRDVFDKGNHPAWGTLIKPGEKGPSNWRNWRNPDTPAKPH